VKLYEFGPTRSIRARWTLQELGVDFEAITVDLTKGEHRSPQFVALNPAARIPVLVDGDRVVTESVAIALYLADKYADRKLLPSRIEDRAECYRWLLFAATELEQPLWRITRNTRLYPEDERQPSDVVIAGREFREMATIVERHLEGRSFLLGDAVSVADFVMAYTLDWGTVVGLLDDFPRLQAYVGRMYARPKAPLRIVEAFARLETARSA
jgi:glutathione S-transferase